jgi:LysR family transcriptional regulator, transcription activator of glutamate synthase operon
MSLLKCDFGMELRQLQYFVLLAEERSFTRAAARANVAQSALSRQVRKLEDELGVPLVDRTSRRVRVTGPGAALVERARRVLAEIDEACAEVRDVKQLLGGRVVIGLTPTTGPLDVAQVLGAFHAQNPVVEVALREELSVVLADQLRADQIDLAFVSGIVRSARDQLTLHPLLEEPLVAVLPPGHSLATRSRLCLNELREDRFIAFPEGATIRTTVFAAADRAGFVPRFAFETYDLHRVRALVAHGLGVAIVPRSDAVSPGHEIATVPLVGRNLRYELFLAWRTTRRLSPAAAAVVQQVARTVD